MRTFYTSTNKCLELAQDNFSDESQQHKWFEDNLHIIFPNLELVKRKMQISNKIPDTVAYDRKANTFVAIEYKNRYAATVRDQVEDYLNMMKEYSDTLIVKYNDRPNITRKRHDSFEWKKMYVIIVAPEFGDKQISNASRRYDECLYELKRFENGIITLRFIAGKRGPIDIIPKAAPTSEVFNATSANIEITSPDTDEHESKNPFYVSLRDKILSTFPGVKEVPKKYYVRFERDGEYLLCTAKVQRSKIKVYFGRKGDIFTENEFVKDVSNSNHHGLGNYYAPVRDEKDVKRLLPILKQVKTTKHRTSND